MNEELSVVLEWVVAAITSPGLKAIVGGVLLDAVLGVSLALKLGDFDWRKLAQFLKTNIAPYAVAYIGLYVIMASLGLAESDLGLAGAQVLLSGLITANLLGDIADKIKWLTLDEEDRLAYL